MRGRDGERNDEEDSPDRARCIAVDFSDPDYARFAHLGADGIRAMLERDKQTLNGLGYDATLVFAPSDDLDLARAEVTKALGSQRWDGILIGNGVRSIPSNFPLFELIVNLVLEHAPQARLCFNTRPDDSAEAVQRWVRP